MFSVTTVTCFVFIQQEGATSLLASPSVPWVPLRTLGEKIMKPENSTRKASSANLVP